MMSSIVRSKRRKPILLLGTYPHRQHKIINTTSYWKCENCWGWGHVIQYESNLPNIKKPYNNDGDKMKCKVEEF
jgi:hypothetical protein